LVKPHRGASLPRPVALRVPTTTGGNPFFALQLGAVLAEAGLPDPDEPWPVPGDLRELVRARLDVLPAPVRAALLTAAARAQSTVSGLSRAALRAAEEAQIVNVGADGRVRFA